MPRAPLAAFFQVCESGHLDTGTGRPQGRRESLGPRAVEVEKPDRLRPQLREPEGHRPADAARADLAHDARPRRLEPGAPGRDEAGVIGVESTRAVRREHDRVDRADRAHERALDRDPRRRPLLVGVGDVDPVVVPRRAPLEQRVEPDPQLGRDQQIVGDLDTPHATRDRVQPRRPRGGDVVADESEANLLHEPFLPGRPDAAQDSAPRPHFRDAVDCPRPRMPRALSPQ